MSLRNVGIHLRPHGIHKPEYHNMNIPYYADRKKQQKKKKNNHHIYKRISWVRTQANVFVSGDRVAVQGEVRY